MSFSIIAELSTAILGGAAVGWITNVIAVNMLFRKYGRWGGVIEERYEEFIENMSDMVEADLVNHKTLQGEFDTPEFKAVLHMWIEELVKKELPEKSGDIRFEELPEIERSIENLLALMRESDENFAENIYRIFADREIQSIISQKQYEYLINTNVENIVSDDSPYKNMLKDILYDFLSKHTVNEFLSQELTDKLLENIQDIIQRMDFSRFNADIDNTYKELYSILEINQVVKNLESELGKMQYADFIKDSERISHALVSRLIEFSASPEGEALLLELAENLLADMKSIQIKLGDMMNPEIKSGIITFIKEKLPGIINNISDFIRDCGDEIEEIINATVDNYLLERRGLVLKTVKDIFISDIAKQFNVVDKIISAINGYSYSSGEKLSGEIISFIETNSIGDIIALLQKENILSAKIVSNVIRSNLQSLEKKNLDIIEKLLHSKIEDHFKVNLSKIETTALPLAFGKFKEDYLYKNAFKEDLQSGINAKITDLSRKDLGSILTKESLTLPLKKESIAKPLVKLWDTLSVKKVSDVISENSVKKLHFKWESVWNRVKKGKLNKVYKALQKDAVYAKTSSAILSLINRNLDKIVSGNVSKLIKNQLKKSSPPQVRAMVQDFMGRELKPINIFGAFLGGIGGVISVFIAMMFDLPQGFMWWLILSYGAIFALVGIGTNWIAIKMLFRPYKKIIFNASPFIGIVALRKPLFARSLSKFVKNKTLNEEALSSFFIKNKDSLQDKINTWTIDSGYDAIDLIFKDDEKSNHISGFIFSAIQKYAVENSVTISTAAVKLLDSFITEGKTDVYLVKLRDVIIEKVYSKEKSDFASYIHAFIVREAESKNLRSYADFFLQNTHIDIARIISDKLETEKLKEFISQKNEWFIAYIEAHSFEDLAGETAADSFSQKLYEKTEELLYTAVGPIVKYIVEYIESKEFNPDTKLEKLFNGKIAELFEKNITVLLGLISKKIGTQRGALIEKIENDLPWYAAPAKPDVEPIVNILIDEELPHFLKRKKGDIFSIAKPLLEYKLSDIGFTSANLNSELIDKAVTDILSSPSVKKKIAVFVQVFAQQFTKVPLKSVLALLNINSIDDLAGVAEPLLDKNLSDIKQRLMQDEASSLLRETMKLLAFNLSDSITLSELFKDINIEKEARNFTEIVLNDKELRNNISELLLNILSGITKNSDFYDKDILQKDIENFINTISEEDWENLRREFIPLFKTLLENLNRAISVETKSALCNEYLTPALLSSAENHFSSIVRAVDVQKIVEREVNAMHPRSIERIFRKFAGRYFAKITLYGWIGVFGGLLSYVISYIIKLFL